MYNYNFEDQKQSWSNPPVDDVGYIDSKELLGYSDTELLALISQLEFTRYSGCRNYENKWRKYLGLDDTFNKTILDFGCGVGIDALQFAKMGNKIYLADIVFNNIKLAQRVFSLHNFDIDYRYIIINKCPFVVLPEKVDVFYCSGVLHHIPYAREIIKRALELLTEEGEIRLMLYSDKGWVKLAEASLPPIDHDITTHTCFDKFVRRSDGVGNYADWYNKEKLEYKFGDIVNIDFCEYICPDDRYLVAILKPKD